jgi:hypothetical protein
MEALLIYIKHHLHFIWDLIERVNDFIFNILYKKRLKKALREVFSTLGSQPYTYRKMEQNDLEELYSMINNQDPADLKFFHPHDFDQKSLSRQFKKNAFLMMAVYDNSKMAGYFFLRFFMNGKCFVGRLIDKDYRGKHIGKVMNRIMYETAWKMNFRCLSTISKNNQFVMRSHADNQKMVVLKDLQNDYLLVEFLDNKENQ